MAKNNLPSWDETEEISTSPTSEALPSWDETEDASPSFLESVGQTAQDTLAGLADTTIGRTAAGLSSGISEMLPSLPSSVDSKLEAQGFKLPQDERSSWDKFKEGYYGGKESLKQTVEDARERSPISTTIGSIGSEISQMNPIAKGLGLAGKTGSKALDLAKLLGVGAGEGALSEISRGDAKLLEGDVSGTLGEAGQGAALGAVGAGLGVAIPKVIGKGVDTLGTALSAPKFLVKEFMETSKLQDPLRAVKKIFNRASRQGSGGVAGINKEVQGRAKNLAENIVTNIRTATSDIGKKIGGLRDLASQDAKVALKASFDGIDDVLNKFEASIPSVGGKTAKDFAKVKEFIKATRAGSKNLDEVDLKVAKKLSDELKSMTTNFIDGVEDIKDKELLALMRDFSKQIDNAVDSEVLAQLGTKYPDRVKEYISNIDKYRVMKDLDAYAGTSTMRGRVKLTGAEKAKAGENIVGKLSDETYDIKSMMSQKEVYDSLNEAGLGKFADDISKQIEEINSGVQVLQYVNPQGAGIGTSLPRNLAAASISGAGKTYGNVKRAISPITEGVSKLVKGGMGKSQAFKKMVQDTMQGSDSEAIRDIGIQMEKAGKMRYSKVIKDLAEIKDPTQRAIRTHALMQQPAFRQDLRATLGFDDEE